MLIWFVVLGVLGAWQIAKNPAVLLRDQSALCGSA